MYTWLRNTWENFRSSFWFVPTLLMVGAAVAAWLMIQIDSQIEDRFAATWYRIELSPPAARSILSSIVGAIVTSTGVVFSITIVALAQASSQFGSRLIRTYRNRRSTHFTLGTFVGTSLYCILVLVSIRENGEQQFVPTVAVTAGIVMAVVCLAALIYYIHDTSNAIQAPNVIQSSADDLHAAIERLFPNKLGQDRSEDESREVAASRIELDDALSLPCIHCNRRGYVQAIKNETVMELAVEHDLVVVLQIRPGDFSQSERDLARVYASDSNALAEAESKLEQLTRQLQNCLIIGTNRTPTQDVRYAFNELVEIAVRALSPGINDPFTAVTCVDQIDAALREIRRRKIPSTHRVDDKGKLRAIAQSVTLTECIEGSLKVIVHYAKDNPMVLARIEEALARLADDTSAVQSNRSASKLNSK